MVSTRSAYDPTIPVEGDFRPVPLSDASFADLFASATPSSYDFPFLTDGISSPEPDLSPGDADDLSFDQLVDFDAGQPHPGDDNIFFHDHDPGYPPPSIEYPFGSPPLSPTADLPTPTAATSAVLQPSFGASA